MKEIVVISGKGGTGKTSITAALASLAERLLVVDCDVDAADLHLILSADVQEKNSFSGGGLAHIDKGTCAECGLCAEKCRFDAISPDFEVRAVGCEGCGVCVKICPVDAISFEPRHSGDWFVSETRFGTLIHARLNAGEGNSGKLVSVIRKRASEMARADGVEYVIVDGPPGTGCAVISSITGADAVLMVIEPTISGIHDFKRVSELARHFGIEQFACTNKRDVNPELADEIEVICRGNGIKHIASIPYDLAFTRAQIEGKTITEYAPDSEAARLMSIIWSAISNGTQKN